MLFQTCTKLTFGLSDVFVVTVIARNRINGVGSLFFRDRILRFGENMPQSLKRFLSNFNVVAIQNSLDGFRNTLNVGNNTNPVAVSLSSGVLLVVTGFRQLRRKCLVLPFAFRTLETYFLSSSLKFSPYRNFGSMNCNFSVTFIKSLNQSSIKPCLIVHLVAMWTLIYWST